MSLDRGKRCVDSTTIVVYEKPDCSLCEKASAILEHLRREFDFRIEHVDITRDGELFRRYRERVPVLILGGQEVAWGIVTIPALRATLSRFLGK